MTIFFLVLYIIGVLLVIFGDGSRDVLSAGLFVAAAVSQLADVLYQAYLDIQKKGIKVRLVKKKQNDISIELEIENTEENNGEQRED